MWIGGVLVIAAVCRHALHLVQLGWDHKPCSADLRMRARSGLAIGVLARGVAVEAGESARLIGQARRRSQTGQFGLPGGIRQFAAPSQQLLTTPPASDRRQEPSQPQSRSWSSRLLSACPSQFRHLLRGTEGKDVAGRGLMRDMRRGAGVWRGMQGGYWYAPRAKLPRRTMRGFPAATKVSKEKGNFKGWCPGADHVNIVKSMTYRKDGSRPQD